MGTWVGYEGEVDGEGRPSGRGIMTWTVEAGEPREAPRCRRYEGELREGLPHGRGVMAYPDGRRVWGEFRLGVEAEVVEVGDGKRYEGQINAAGQPSGLGVMTWPGGMRYEGFFFEGKPHGRGVFLWPDGEWFEGFVRDGTPESGVGANMFLGGLLTRLEPGTAGEPEVGLYTLGGRPGRHPVRPAPRKRAAPVEDPAAAASRRKRIKAIFERRQA